MLTGLLATAAAWLATQGAGLLLGFLAQVISTTFQQWQANSNATDLGRVTSELGQATAAAAAKGAELAALANAPKDIDGAVKRLEKGSA